MVNINTIIFLVDTNKHKVYVVHKTRVFNVGARMGFLSPQDKYVSFLPTLPNLVTYVNITEWYNKTHSLDESFL